ncbi:MAG: type VI secretion system baseplate subunit TssK [Candidatus Eisenbacteria bacterium]|nr:type VI secretion system baseplate subunit TssK [Candidatus Eisenbacteria bacterium]
MSRFHRILWSEGQFLLPQHFQQWDLFQESENAGARRLTQVWPWGIHDLSLDSEMLARGTFRLLTLSAMLPGGARIEAPDIDPLPASISFKDTFDGRAESMDIFLGLPLRRNGWANCLLPGESGDAAGEVRYVARPVTVPDENSGKNDRPILRADQNLRLLQSSDQRDNFETLPLARIVRSSSGGYQLHADFVPPLLNIKASAVVTEMVRGLVERLSARSSELGARFTEAGSDARDVTNANLRAFMNFFVVNGAIPPLAHFRSAPLVHPETLHRFLAALAGQLATFNARRLHPRDLPDYDHFEPGPVMKTLERILLDLLELEVSQGYEVIPLVPAGEGRVNARIPRATFFEPGAALILTVGGESLGEADVSGGVRRLVVASQDKIQQKLNNRLPGLALHPLPVPPPAIPRRRNTWYFQLDSRGADWEAIRAALNLAIDIPTELQAAQIELLGLEARS